MKVAVAAALLVVVFLGSVGTAVGIGIYVYHRQDTGWCSILGVITAHRVPKPADPAANPSRVASYELYHDALVRSQQIGCG